VEYKFRFCRLGYWTYVSAEITTLVGHKLSYFWFACRTGLCH